MTLQAVGLRPARRRLFAAVDIAPPCGRGRLAAVAHAGHAGVRIPGHRVLSRMADRDLVALIALLRDARGFGLRVWWRGECGALDVRHLVHLDPPRDRAGALAWTLRPAASLVARCGPRFVIVDDARFGPRRRTVIDRFAPGAHVIAATDWGSEIVRADQAAVRRFAVTGLVLCAGDHCVGLPVRPGFWRV